MRAKALAEYRFVTLAQQDATACGARQPHGVHPQLDASHFAHQCAMGFGLFSHLVGGPAGADIRPTDRCATADPLQLGGPGGQPGWWRLDGTLVG